MNTNAKYIRCFILLVVSAATFGPSCDAAVTVEEDSDRQGPLTVYRMTVTPAAEPVPALKHRLTLRPHERRPGNAATHYLRSVWENSLQLRTKRAEDKFGRDRFYSWMTDDIPIGDLPLEEVREAANIFLDYVNYHISRATRCRDCDWGLAVEDTRGVHDTIGFLLPDAQGSRQLSRVLSLVTRVAIAEKRYDDAIEFMRMNYQLGQDFGKQKFLVCNLVGIAEVGIANSNMLDLLASPNSPNMYWALSELPRPIVPIRESIRLEMSLGLRIFPALIDIEEKNHSTQEWSRLLNEIFVESALLGDELRLSPKEPMLSRLAMAGMSIVCYPGAKQRLIDSGMNAERVEAMPVAQVLLVDMAREWQRIADQFEKWHYVDFFQAVGRMREADSEFEGNVFEGGNGRMLAGILLPAVSAARSAEIRTQWEMDALRVIEALRMHAAETGRLPARLDQIQVVPVPLNPITRNPYVYRLRGKTGILELPFTDGMRRAKRFEITLAKDK